MKPLTTPTSPNSGKSGIAPARIKVSVLFFAIVIAVIFSLGLVFLTFFLAEKYPISPFFNHIPVRRPSDNIIVRQDLKSDSETIRKIIREVQPSLGTLVRHSDKALTAVSAYVTPVTFLTSDGIGVVLPIGKSGEKNDILMNSGEPRPVSQLISPQVPLTLIRSEGGSAALAIAEISQLELGEQVWLLHFDATTTGLTVARAAIASVNGRNSRNDDNSESSDQLDRRILLDRELNSTWAGSAVVQQDGKLIGIFSSQSSVIPLAPLRRRISDLASGNALPSLGITTIDLAYLNDPKIVPSRGLMILTVSARSAAATADLRKSDIITDLDGAPVSPIRNLSDVLLQHKPGDTVEIVLNRDGVVIKKSVILGTLEVLNSQP